MYKIKTKIAALLWIAVTVWPISSLCAEDLYKIEIIVFRYKNQHDVLSDDLSQHKLFFHELSRAKNLLPPTSIANIPSPYSLLPKNYLSLMPEEKSLKNQRNFDVILHAAWLQPITDKTHATAVHIYGGDIYTSLGQHLSDTSDNIYLMPPDDKKGIWELNGFVKTSQNYSFNLKTDFVLSIPNNKKDDPSKLQQYFMNQTQQMQLNDLLYFDHPFFGMLAKITAFNVQEPDQSSSDDDNDELM